MFTRVKKKKRAHKAKRHPNKQTKKQNNLLVVKLLCNDKQTNMHILQSAAGPLLEGDGGVPQHSNQRLV